MENLHALITKIKLYIPRLTVWIILTLGLLATMLIAAPHQVPVVIYKLALVSFAAIVGYWIDRSLCPYARPDSYLREDWRVWKVSQTGDVNNADYPVIIEYRWVFIAAMLRRAIIMAAVILAMALGL